MNALYDDNWKRALAFAADPASEREVSMEIQKMLREKYFAVTLSDWEAGTQLQPGTLVYMTSEYRRKPAGISAGLPDLWLARVGYWGWHGAELKERGKEGKPAGRASPEQKTAQASGLYPIVWDAEHIRRLIQDNDRKARYGAYAVKPKRS